jgi:hypothetical protein
MTDNGSREMAVRSQIGGQPLLSLRLYPLKNLFALGLANQMP